MKRAEHVLNPPAVTDWPRWTDRLVSRLGSDVYEGGRRTNVHPKAGAANQPLVTYITVVRNNATTLPRAIESVQSQTYPFVEHVILDGASTDGTLDVITQYADRIDYFASEPDAGLYDALNKAVPLARGNLICVLNSDDWLEPDAAETAVNHLVDVDASTILLTGAIARAARAAGERPAVVLDWTPAFVHPGSYFTCADVCHNGIYATRSAYERSGPYDATYEIAADFKWIMTCLDAGITFVYTRTRTVHYVLGGASGDAEKHGLECVRAIRERFPSLTPEEAGGLYHTFFAFPTLTSIPGRPDDRRDFLSRFLLDRSDDHELLRAVAWALLVTQDLRDQQSETHEQEATSVRPTLKQRVTLALRDHPSVYRTAERLYAAMRRG